MSSYLVSVGQQPDAAIPLVLVGPSWVLFSCYTVKGGGVGEMEEAEGEQMGKNGQKIQNSNYKINNYWRCNV